VKHIFWAIQTAVIYCLTLLAALLPASVAYRIGAMAGLLIPYIVPKRRTVIIDNITLSLPFMKAHRLWDSKCEDVAELARDTFKNLGRC
jgi:KDO2-lipid IV(A) lauroyltransferase